MSIFEGSDKQIKVFTIPVILDDKLFYSQSSSKIYKIGDAVPYRTWWYNYSPDFTIVDGYDIFVINDGRYELHEVYERYRINDYKDYFGPGRTVINNRDGGYLTINDKYDLDEYMSNQRDYEEFRAEVYEVANRISNDDLTELINLALENSFQKVDVNEYYNHIHNLDSVAKIRNIGAYLWLAKDFDNARAMKLAKQYISGFLGGADLLETYLIYIELPKEEASKVKEVFARLYEDNV